MSFNYLCGYLVFPKNVPMFVVFDEFCSTSKKFWSIMLWHITKRSHLYSNCSLNWKHNTDKNSYDKQGSVSDTRRFRDYSASFFFLFNFAPYLLSKYIWRSYYPVTFCKIVQRGRPNDELSLAIDKLSSSQNCTTVSSWNDHKFILYQFDTKWYLSTFTSDSQ